MAIGSKTVTANTTSTTIVFAETTTIAVPRDVPLDVEWCITVVDMDRNSKPITIAAGPAGLDGECISPPTYQGYQYITARSAAEPSKVPIGTDWCVTVADIDRNGRPIPVDAGPAGADGECSVPPTHSGIPVITTLTIDSKAPEPSKELLPMSQAMDLASPSSVQVLAGTVASSASAVTPLPSKPLS